MQGTVWVQGRDEKRTTEHPPANQYRIMEHEVQGYASDATLRGRQLSFTKWLQRRGMDYELTSSRISRASGMLRTGGLAIAYAATEICGYLRFRRRAMRVVIAAPKLCPTMTTRRKLRFRRITSARRGLVRADRRNMVTLSMN